MAADSDVIREFLVRLGFQVNESGSKKFDDTLDRTGKRAITAGKSILGIAAATQAMVAAYAHSMEKLYYASRRTGASVENIQALEFGSRKIGLAAGEAQGALEGMAAAVRVNPGLRGLMDQLLGHDSAGMDQAKAMIELVQRLSSMPHYIGSQFAGMFGIDEKTFLMLKQGLPELIKGEEERRNMNRRAGIDAQAAAAASVEYANSLRDLTARIGVLVGKLSLELLPAFREFNRLAVQAIDYVQTLDFSKIGADMATPQLQELNAAIGEFIKTWKGLSESEPGQNFFANLKNNMLGAGEALTKLITGLVYLASGEWSKGGKSVWEGIKGAVKNSPGAAAARGAFDWINTWRDSYRDPNAPSSAYNGESPAEAAARRARGVAAPPAASAAPAGRRGGDARGVRNNNPGNLEYRNQDGATSDGRFAVFKTPGEGLRAMAAQLDRYNERGLNTIAKVVSTWAPSAGGENNTAAYIDYVSKKMGVGANAKLDLKDADVLSKLMGSMIGKENGYNPYNDTQLLSYAQERVGDGTVTIHQKTDIHVGAGPTAAATGAEVGRAQSRVNGDIVRNLQGATR